MREKTPIYVAIAALLLCIAPAALAAGGTVAQIGSKSITLDEVDAKAKAAGLEAYQALYDARRAALDGMIADRLLEAEAKTQGISKDALIEKEIRAKIKPVTDADVEAFFNENKQGIRGALDQVREQIRGYLGQLNAASVHTDYVDKLKKKSNVRISLDPPRAEVVVASNDPSKGPASAPIEVIEYSEFQ